MVDSFFSNARAVSQENYLLGKDRLNRMLESETAEEAYKILLESGFGNGAVGSCADFENLISAEMQKFRSFLDETCVNGAFKSFLLIKNDYHNAEAFIRSKYLNVRAEDFTVQDGLIEKSVLKGYILSDKYDSLPKSLKTALINIDEAFVSGNASGFFVSSEIKKALYSEYKKICKGDLKKILEVKADAVNIGAVLRSDNYEQAKKNFVCGGSVSEATLKKLSEAPEDQLKSLAKDIKSELDIVSAVEDVIMGKPLTELEREADGYALKYFKKFKYSADGDYPYMLYCYYKLNEIENVRIIMVGLLNGIDKNEIKRRLRETYER